MREFELNDDDAVGNLIELCTKGIPDPETRSNTVNLINEAKKTQKVVVPMDKHYLDGNVRTLPLAELANVLAKFVDRNEKVGKMDERVDNSSKYVGRERAMAPEMCSVKQKLPRSIVSAVQTLNKPYKKLNFVGISIFKALFI